MFSPQTRFYFDRAKRFGELQSATHRGSAGKRAQGHYFEIALRIEGPYIKDLAYYCPRCVPAVACGAYLEESLLEQPLSRAMEITTMEILRVLGGLPVQRSFYAWLAVQALHNAIRSGKEDEGDVDDAARSKGEPAGG